MSEKPYTILCVDDERNILEILKRLFRKETYRVLTALSGTEGLQILRENDVNIVISDQRMTEMQGTEFLKTVKEHYPDVLTAILTGNADVETIKEALNRGHITRFFLKPWNSDELKLGIRDLVYQYDRKHNMSEINRKVARHIRDVVKRDISKAAEMAKERKEKSTPRNKALAFSYAFLEEMPMPIVGVDDDKRVVLINQKAKALSRTGKMLEIGRKLSDCLSKDIEEGVAAAIANNCLKKIEKYDAGGGVYDIEVAPLGGELCGKGAFLKFALKS